MGRNLYLTMCARVICGVVLVMLFTITVSRGCLQDRRFYNFCYKTEMRCERNTDCCEGRCRPSPIPPYKLKCF
ncbi:hypothetical protein MTO96_008589 [Rhipicephalus appendiculatus]